MAKETGKNVILKVGDGGGTEVFTALSGQKDTKLSISGQSIDVSDKTTNNWGATLAGTLEASVSVSGFVNWPDTAGWERLRAQAMQEAVPVGQGAMAAILGLDADAVRAGCAEAAASGGEVVEAVNFNDPKQTVIAGSKAGVAAACELLKARGAKRALPLPVSAPFHSSLMKPAAEKLKLRLAEVAVCVPTIPVVNNIDVGSPMWNPFAPEKNSHNSASSICTPNFRSLRMRSSLKPIESRPTTVFRLSSR